MFKEKSESSDPGYFSRISTGFGFYGRWDLDPFFLEAGIIFNLAFREYYEQSILPSRWREEKVKTLVGFLYLIRSVFFFRIRFLSRPDPEPCNLKPDPKLWSRMNKIVLFPNYNGRILVLDVRQSQREKRLSGTYPSDKSKGKQTKKKKKKRERVKIVKR